MKGDLRAWNEVFGNVEREKRLLLDDLQVFEGLEEEECYAIRRKWGRIKLLLIWSEQLCLRR
jgi:hypothetical protein